MQNPADLQGSASGASRLKAAALVNVSPRPCPPEEEQKKAVAGGAKEAARKVRGLRAGRVNVAWALPAPCPSLGCFGQSA